MNPIAFLIDRISSFFARGEDGQDAIEYLLVIGAIAVVVVIAAAAFDIGTLVGDVEAAVDGVLNPGE